MLLRVDRHGAVTALRRSSLLLTMADAVPAFDPKLTLGALEIGVLISYCLFGLTTLQAYMYFQRFPQDHTSLKYLAGAVWCCELGHTICVGNTLYIMTISYYGQPERLLRTPASLLTSIIFSALVSALVQGFFSYRIYRLSNSLHVPSLFWGVAFVRLVLSLLASVEALRMVSLADYEQQWGWLLTTVWGIGAMNDLAIAGTIVYLIYKQQSEILPKRTVAVLDKLMLWSIETGMLTSVSGIAMLICFLTMRRNYIWLVIYVINTRFFSNALLANLNSREALRAMSEADITIPDFTTDSSRSRSKSSRLR
ncbi:hypothetical protein DFH07DRAFT_250975 [Mycena maculata]|uniref:DUF6534 domain-containing protein n=1 Tax=Mycena maculata TaxID=230809 RepID=A0AAD7MNK2_9AGAR|nr:hypothetical protein DFH07DRAFT_250975 [Mycena maculata]